MYCRVHIYYITRHVLPSRYYISLLFGCMVMLFSSYDQKFGPPVFYLFGRPDWAQWSSSNGTEETKHIFGRKNNQKKTDSVARFGEMTPIWGNFALSIWQHCETEHKCRKNNLKNVKFCFWLFFWPIIFLGWTSTDSNADLITSNNTYLKIIKILFLGQILWIWT